MEKCFILSSYPRPTPVPISKLKTTGRVEALAAVFDRVIIGGDRIIGVWLVIISNSRDNLSSFFRRALPVKRTSISCEQILANFLKASQNVKVNSFSSSHLLTLVRPWQGARGPQHLCFHFDKIFQIFKYCSKL